MKKLLLTILSLTLLAVCLAPLSLRASEADAKKGKCPYCGKCNWYVEDYDDPSCTDSGWFDRKCKSCKHWQTGSFGKALGHKWTYKTTRKPTCTKTGIKKQICTRKGCGKIGQSISIPKKGHNYGKQQTGTVKVNGITIKAKYKKCKTCGHIKVDAKLKK